MEQRQAARLHFRDELHPRVRQVQWLAQRTMWALMAFLLAAALVGFCGGGPMSGDSITTSSDAGSVRLEYERWARAKSSQSLQVSISRQGAGDVALVIGNRFAKRIVIERVSPPPDSTSLTPQGAVYSWSAGAGDVVIRLDYQVLRWGRLTGELTARFGGPERTLRFRQLVLP